MLMSNNHASLLTTNNDTALLLIVHVMVQSVSNKTASLATLSVTLATRPQVLLFSLFVAFDCVMLPCCHVLIELATRTQVLSCCHIIVLDSQFLLQLLIFTLQLILMFDHCILIVVFDPCGGCSLCGKQ